MKRCYNLAVGGSQKRAFSLIEVMSALLLISVGLFALVALQIHSLRMQQGSTDRHTASVLASDLMDEAVAALEEDFEQDVAAARQASAVEGFEFSRSVAPDPASPLLKVVLVEVYWSNPNGEFKFRLETKVVKT